MPQSVRGGARVSVTAFVDWQSQMYNWRLVTSSLEDEHKASLVLERTSRMIARSLTSFDGTGRYQVSLRLYHGWTKGYQDMPNRLAVRRAVAATDFSELSRSQIVVINSNVGYGDTLLTARTERLYAPKGIHLPGTVRIRDRAGRREEKMVDTALASDLLSLARSDPADWSIVLAEDDDLVPPIFTAEAWKAAAGGRVLLLQKRIPTGRIVNLDGLLLNGVWNDRS